MNAFGINDLGLFCAAVFLPSITPGPDTAYIIGRRIHPNGRAVSA